MATLKYETVERPRMSIRFWTRVLFRFESGQPVSVSIPPNRRSMVWRKKSTWHA